MHGNFAKTITFNLKKFEEMIGLLG